MLLQVIVKIFSGSVTASIKISVLVLHKFFGVPYSSPTASSHSRLFMTGRVDWCMLWAGFFKWGVALEGWQKITGMEACKSSGFVTRFVSVACKQRSGSVSFWTSRICYYFTDSIPDPFIIKQKILKNLDFIQFCDFLITFYLWRLIKMYPQKISKKTCKKNFFCWHLESLWRKKENSKIQVRNPAV